MPTPVHSLDAFLAAPSEQRDATRAIRAVLARARGLTLVFGDEVAAGDLVAALARTLPDTGLNGALIEVAPPRLLMRPWRPDAASLPLVDTTPTEALRALLRQDPDVIALTTITAETGPIALRALFTGHQMILGCGAPTLDAAIALLVGGEAWLQPQVAQLIDLAIELRAGRLHRVCRGERTLVEFDGARCVLHRELLPPSAADGPLHEARFAPPLAARPPATRAPRRAFVPVTGISAADRSALATPWALRPEGSTWPCCRSCAAPLAHVVTLDLATLPATPRRGAGLAQLFVCSSGCETGSERDPGVLAEILPDGNLRRLEAPPVRVEVLQPGPIVQWLPFAEDPLPGDDEPIGDGDADAQDQRPLRGDKLFGWPAWEQGEAWPLDEHGERHELLFQFAEGTMLHGGREPGWDFDRAEALPGEAASPVLDPNRPQHIRSLLTGEAIGFLFVNRAGDRLAFRWQTG